MAKISNGTESAAPTQKRRVMSANSGLGSSAPATAVIGSSAMPQIGQAAGPSRTISGCIGQVQSPAPATAAGAGAEAGAGARKRLVSAVNRSRQRALQKK